MPFDFEAAVTAPFRMQPGLRRLAAGQAQLTPAFHRHRDQSRHFSEKLAVLSAFAGQALCRVPGFDAEPALATVAAQAAAEHPLHFRLDGPTWCAPALGWAQGPGDVPPQPCFDGLPDGLHEGAQPLPDIGPLLQALAPEWRRAALLCLAVCEDLAIVDGRSGTLPWLAVALPSAWAPEEKVGRHFAQVHAPVADNRLILQAAEPLLALATGGERWERFVWTLSPQPRLHAHPQRLAPERRGAQALQLSGDALAALTWWRTEHQSFIPVPGKAQAVFTIKVDTQPLPQAINSPARAARLHAALASMSPAVLAYRGLTEVQPALLAWLAQRAAP